MKLLFVVLCAVVLGSCSSKKGPEAVLKSYIEKRFSSGIDKDEFADFFGGEMLDDLETIDEAVLGNMNEVKDYKKRAIKINVKNCTDNKCFLTYTLTFNAKAKANDIEKSVGVKVKKIAELQKTDNLWKIHDISDIKTHFDYK